MKVISTIRTPLLALGAFALAVSSTATVPALAQSTAAPAPITPFGLPADVKVFDDGNPNERSATAVVNGYVITGTDIEQRVKLITNASQTNVSEEELQRLRAQVLRNLIDETLKIQAAEAQEIGVQKAQIDQTYNQLAAQNFGQNTEAMDTYLESIGSSANALKRQIEGELAWENLIRRNISPFVNVSAEEVTGVLERLEASRGTEEYRLGEIYMSATAENREAVLQNMNRIVEQLQQGGSFVAYARQFSEASTAIQGGDTDFLRLGTLPGPMAEAVQTMQPGQLVGPLAIPGGFTIIYLIDKRQVLMADPRDAVLSLKQISIELPDGVSDADATAAIERFGNYVQTLSGCADAENAMSAIGASVVANPEIQVRQLPEQLQSILLNMQIGQTTPPFGTAEDGVRVLMLCGRDDPEDAGAPTFQSVMNSIEDERINKRAQRYLRDLRNDAYIEYN
ncbi:peptidylprolyl isomerase [Erythrobacter longus]|uniref:Parvulin-like PPIase n=1 Tax=Erythrobacter longus TaxID=1044 RepID=A0A074MGL5_ERYLO|nr:peptidylprolyl isomerase [Erythrobacter longus]KEO91970.1 peptidylprolyl isomerase [Erythrobacter longus]